MSGFVSFVSSGPGDPDLLTVKALKRLRSSVVIPMHWFSDARLEAFLAGMGDAFDIRREEGSEMTVSLHDLPARPTVVVLRPHLLD